MIDPFKRKSVGYFIWTVVVAVLPGLMPARDAVAQIKNATENPRTSQRKERAGRPVDYDGYMESLDGTERPGKMTCLWRTASLSNQMKPEPIVREDTIFLNLGGFAAIDRTDGSVKWQYRGKYGGGSNIESTPRLVLDFLFAGTNSYSVLAIDCRTGENRWFYRTGGWVQAHVHLDVKHDRLFVGAWDKALHAVRLSTGKGLWKAPTLGRVGSECCLVNNAVAFCDQNHLCLLRPGDGKHMARHTFPDTLVSGPIRGRGKSIFVWCADGNLYQMKLEKNRNNWRLAEAGRISIAPSRRSVQEGFPHTKHRWFRSDLLLLDDSGTVVYLNAKDQEVRWSMKADRERGRPCDFTTFKGRRLLFAFAEGSIMAVDQDTGVHLWRAVLPGVVEPNIVYAREQLIAVDTRNGQVLCYGFE